MDQTRKAMFGAGCFWGVQSSFDRLDGVTSTTVGYSGGSKKDPTYQDVCSGTTGHAEVVLVEFDPEIVGYGQLLDYFFSIHDPTTKDRQGLDTGSQYRSSIMYFDDHQRIKAENKIREMEARTKRRNSIVTEVVPAGPFYRAEEYHQKYHRKHGLSGCRV